MKPPFTFLPTSSHWPPSSFDSQSKHPLHLRTLKTKHANSFFSLLPIALQNSLFNAIRISSLSLPPSLQEDFPPTHAQPMVIYSSLRIHVFFLFHRMTKIHLHPLITPTQCLTFSPTVSW